MPDRSVRARLTAGWPGVPALLTRVGSGPSGRGRGGRGPAWMRPTWSSLPNSPPAHSAARRPSERQFDSRRQVPVNIGTSTHVSARKAGHPCAASMSADSRRRLSSSTRDTSFGARRAVAAGSARSRAVRDRPRRLPRGEPGRRRGRKPFGAVHDRLGWDRTRSGRRPRSMIARASRAWSARQA